MADEPDARELQAQNRDLVALLALPAMWTATANAGRGAVVEILLDVLLSMLRLDWVFAHVDDPPLVLARVDGRVDAGAFAPLIEQALGSALHADGELPREITDPCGAGRVRITRVKLLAQRAVIVAASRRETFPSQRDQLVLRVASNQTAIGLQAARLIEAEHRRSTLLAKLSEAALAIHSQASLTEVLRETTERARDIIGAHAGITSLTVGAGFEQIVHSVSLGDKYAAWRGYDVQPSGSGIYRIVCETNRPMRLTQDKLEAHPAWRGFGKEAGRHPPLRGWLAVPLIARDGRNLGVVQLTDKIAGEFDESDEQILVQLAQLAAVAVENTRLTEDLRASQAQALAADRRKDEFLALLGHELRNPLAPIVTALELMKLRETGVAQRERLIIERQVRHVMRLVDDLLDISRVTRGKLELRPARTELGTTIAKAIEAVEPLLEARGHRLDVDVPAAGLEVIGDPARLCQVFTNLISNAAKYTPDRGLVRVRARGSQTDITIAVTDNGNGIAPELLPHMFEMFVQGARGVDRAEGGLGLGLAIVRTFVELHGGRVTAHSEGPGKGSEFLVTLPRAGFGPLSIGDAPPTLSTFPANGERSTVLVVDDNADARELLADSLELLGHTVFRACDGSEALGVASRHRVDVALIDIGLPVMDGFEVARRLRELSGPRVRLFAVTGYGQQSDRTAAEAAGFDRHFVKPVNLVALQEAITTTTRG